MEFKARFPEVTARAATFEDDGDKIMVLFRGGVPVEILPTSVFDVVYAPTEPPPDVPVPTNGKVKHPKVVKSVPKTKKVASAVVTPGARFAEILALIRKKPMSSGELIEAMKVNSSIVYSTVNVMKGKGDIEGRIDEVDGTRRWFPKGLI